ncbi:MAG: hypothetical protein ACR2JB_25465 [Bryobacteraceae bacterium]
MEVLIIAGLLGLVAVGVWNARRWLPDWASPTAPAVASSGVVGKPDAKLERASGKRRGDRAGRSSVVSNFTIGDLPGSKTEVDVPMGSPFPTRNDLPIGAAGAQILAKYGEPTARVTAMQNGRLVERYYYVNSERTQLVVATLEHGVVVSVDGPSR